MFCCDNDIIRFKYLDYIQLIKRWGLGVGGHQVDTHDYSCSGKVLLSPMINSPEAFIKFSPL